MELTVEMTKETNGAVYWKCKDGTSLSPVKLIPEKSSRRARSRFHGS